MSILETAAAGRSGRDFRLQLAGALWRASVLALVVMPFGMAIAHRSSAAFLVLSAVCALGAATAEGQARRVLHDAAAALKSPLGLSVLAFLAWTLASIGWSEFKTLSLQGWGEFWLSVAAGFAVAMTLPKRLTPAAFWVLAGAMVAACLLIVVELSTWLAVRKSLGMRADVFIFNRPSLTLLVSTPPLMVWLAVHLRHGWVFGLGLLLIVGGTIAYSESNAADLGLAVGCLAFLAAWMAPRWTGRLMIAGFAIALAVAPVVGPLGDSLIPASLHKKMASAHSRERVDIWISFGSAIREQPLLGGGFGVSPRLGQTAVAAKVPEEHRLFLTVGHPHNMAIQIWTELGLVGVVLAFAVFMLAVRAMLRQPHLIMCASLALTAGATAVALVGHGAWQGWWAASLGAALALMLGARTTLLETGHEPVRR